MKAVLCHNHYRQRGGEDESFAAEASLLEARGHEVVRYTIHNDVIGEMNTPALVSKTIWNRQAYREMFALLRRERPDVMHCTNTFPLISPAVYYAARDVQVPVVQALRNYRLLCPNALLMRNNRVCQDCLGKVVPWPAVLHGCYRGSRPASAVVTAMLATHRWLKTWRDMIDHYFTLTEFARSKFIEGGLPADKISVKPNFVPADAATGTGQGGYFVFVGRLSPEKGIDTLLATWSQLTEPLVLRVIGDGPLEAQVAAAAAADPRIEWLGRRSPREVGRVLADARALIMPSIWFETFGRTIIEAYVQSTPVIASNLGAMAELVVHERTGLLFPAGDATSLADCVRRLNDDHDLHRAMRHAARREYEAKYTPEANYEMLLDIYARAGAVAKFAGKADPLSV